MDNGARQSLEKVHPLQEPRVCFHTLAVGRCDTVGILPVPNIQNRRFGILYDIWRRRHYDKSTISFLSDCGYQKNFLPDYWKCKQHWLYLFVEKKIEIWHSLLRAHTQSHDDAATIEKVAKTVRSSAFLASFWGAFVPGYTRGDSRFDFWLIAGKSAEFILQMVSEIAKNTGRAHVVSISKKR